MTVGRFTTEKDVDETIVALKRTVGKLREMSPLWDMHLEGVDISKVQWAAH
jgi:cysteine desulfurase